MDGALIEKNPVGKDRQADKDLSWREILTVLAPAITAKSASEGGWNLQITTMMALAR